MTSRTGPIVHRAETTLEITSAKCSGGQCNWLSFARRWLSVGRASVGAMEGESVVGLAERRQVVAAAGAALRELSAVQWECQNGHLDPCWASWTPWPAQRRRVGWPWSGSCGPLGRGLNEPLRDSVLKGDCSVHSAAVVMKEIDRLRQRLRPEAVPTVMAGLVHLAETSRPSDIRKLRPRLIAEYGAAGELQADQDAAKRAVSLSQPWDGGDEACEYRLVLDPEGSAALGPLFAPRPAQGDPDLRSGDQRRGCRVEIVRRAVAAAESVPASAKTS
jgi:hypothetical protein